jgi:hypothetical protein|tara:strand:- start:8762 stop:8935 length:174 start_codon:yes stop_codon:yes gene_type:complete
MNSEDTINEVYYEVDRLGLKKEFDKQVKKMITQDKHKFKSSAEKWEYALYKVKGLKK